MKNAERRSNVNPWLLRELQEFTTTFYKGLGLGFDTHSNSAKANFMDNLKWMHSHILHPLDQLLCYLTTVLFQKSTFL